MNYKLLILATASTLILAGCSSSGEGGSATLAAAVPTEEQETDSTNDNVSSDDNSSQPPLSPAQIALQTLPTFNSQTSTQDGLTDGQNLPTSNLNGSVGRSSFSEPTQDVQTGDTFGQATINGETYTVNLSQDTSANGGVFVSEDGRLILLDSDLTDQTFGDLEYVEITGYVTGTNFNNANAPTFTGVGTVVEGLLTPVDSLPSQATYSGQVTVISLQSLEDTTSSDSDDDSNPYTVNNFTATAAFGETNTLRGSLVDRANEESVATIEADITGNTFSGTINDNDGAGSTSLDGGFFGPSANEIVGVGSGVVENERIGITISGSRTEDNPGS